MDTARASARRLAGTLGNLSLEHSSAVDYAIAPDYPFFVPGRLLVADCSPSPTARLPDCSPPPTARLRSTTSAANDILVGAIGIVSRRNSPRLAVALFRDAFHQAVFRRGWHDSLSRKPARPSRMRYSSSVRSCPPGATSIVRSSSLAKHGSLPGWNDGFDNQEPPGWFHGSANVFQNAGRSFFIPIVNDVPQDIGVGTGGSGLKEVPCDQTDASDSPAFSTIAFGPLDHAGKVEQRALQIWMPSQDGAQRRAVSAPDVGHRGELREIVGVQHRARVPAVRPHHGLVEVRRLFGMLRKELEQGLSEDSVEGGLAGADAIEELAPGPEILLSHHDRQRPF